MPHDEEITTSKLLLCEYERIKDEQKSRIGFRDNLIYATLVSAAAVIAAILPQQGRTSMLLLLPPVSFVLGWTYLVNDEKISAIGRYIRNQLAPQLMALRGDATPIFQWEIVHRNDPRRVSRKFLQLLVNLTTFVIPSAVALVIYWVNARATTPLLTLSVAEAAALAVLAVQIILYADVVRGA